MGKIMFLWGTAEDGQDGRTADETAKQWALGGDTFVVGCMIPDNAVVFPEFNKLNPDMKDKRYNSLYGMYEPNCGLDKLCFAYGHDEYMYKASFLGSIVQITRKNALLTTSSFMSSHCSTHRCWWPTILPFHERVWT